VYDITINVTEPKVIEALSMYYRVPTMPAAIERLVTLVLE
jgi:alanine dehydrogenase